MKRSVNTKLLASVFIALIAAMGLSMSILFSVQHNREVQAAEDEVLSVSHMLVHSLEFAMNEGIFEFDDFQKEAETTGHTRELRILPTEVLESGANAKLDEFELASFNTAEIQITQEEFNGESVVRVATPMVATGSCIDCHGGNVGDVMSVVSIRSSIDENMRSLAAFQVKAGLMIIGAIVLTLVLIYFLVRHSIIRKLKNLVSFSNDLARGDLTTTMQEYGEDEVGEVASSLASIHDMLKTKAEEANSIANGDLSLKIKVLSEQDELGFAMRRVSANLLQMRDELADTIEQQIAGNLDSRCRTEIVAGTYRELMEGINRVIDAIVAPMMRAVTLLSQYAEGDFSKKMDDLPGKQIEFTRALNTINENLTELCGEGMRFITATRNGELGLEFENDRFHGTYRQIVEGFSEGLANLKAPIRQTIRILEALAQGDLTESTTGDFVGEYAILNDSLTATLDSLNEMMGLVTQSVESVTVSSDQVSTSSQSMSAGATQQASSLEEINAAMVELDAQTKENTTNATEVRRLSTQALQSARTGDEQMESMLGAMKDITDDSQKVQRIIKIIDEIAFQTNLLALNAAVEAARAGVHGRGFAVVAEEVRNLAQRSAKAAAETNEIIEGNLASVTRGSDIAQNTAGSLKEIIESIGNVADLVSGIAKSSEEQTNVTHDISSSLNQIDSITQSNAAVAEETAAAAEELHSQITTLQGMLERFSLRNDEHGTVASSRKAVSGTSSNGNRRLHGLNDDDFELEDLSLSDFD
ncbi:HAMP domain-containing protein [bacterium]|nr:HAMP domain-containing protein [bacterium]